MQLVVFALLGCCVVAHSASLSDTLTVKKSSEKKSGIDFSPEETRREKRSGIDGSGGFFAGIGSAILGKVAQASSGSSSGSSHGNGHQFETVEYGPPVHKYEDPSFDIWSFKKAILNTLFQALKAIGGGVIALKGKLIKGGGVVVSAKGNIISAKGEAISTLGRQIAASAILTPPKTSHAHIYEAPAIHVHPGHDSYGGPPPSVYSPHGGYAESASSDSYGHSGYASPSDDADHPGLLIVRSLKEEKNEEHPSLDDLEESFGGSKKNFGLENLLKKLQASAANFKNGKNCEKFDKPSTAEISIDLSHSNEHVEHKEIHPASSYGTPGGFGDEENGNNHHETHVVHNEGNSQGIVHHLDEEKLDSSVASLPLQHDSQQPHENVHQDYQQGGNFGLGSFGNENYLSQSNFQSLGNGQFAFSMPVEIPILQSHNHHQMYNLSPYPKLNQLQDFNIAHNSYNGIFKRNTRPGIRSGFKFLPPIGHGIKDPRIYRI